MDCATTSPVDWRPQWSWFLLLVYLGASATTRAQIDPEKRRLFQLGYNQPLQGRGPLSGYAFYYFNQPGFIQTNLTLRLAIAPVYVDSELGIREALSPHTDLAVGLAGGGLPKSGVESTGVKSPSPGTEPKRARVFTIASIPTSAFRSTPSCA